MPKLPDELKNQAAEMLLKFSLPNSPYWRQRAAVLIKYGSVCACCGEAHPAFLAIDHVNGGGNDHRASTPQARTNITQWLVTNEFPEGFQVLCHNCNMASRGNKKCPHKGRPDPPKRKSAEERRMEILDKALMRHYPPNQGARIVRGLMNGKEAGG